MVEVPRGQGPEDVALLKGGTVVDPGPYPSFDDAKDALIDLEYDVE